MSQGLEIGLKQASEMNVFFLRFEGFEGLGGIPLHILPLGALRGGGGLNTDQFHCVLFRERCPSGNSLLITPSFCIQTWYVSRCRETA